MKILLHIGQSKTGTSAIQSYLTLNRTRLRDHGVLYPMITIGGMSVDLGSHNSVADALSGLSRYPNLTADEYFGQFFNDAKQVGAKLMILSAEHFFGGEPRIWDVPDEKTYFARYRMKIEALARYLAGYDVKLMAYLRPQVDWLASAISQTVRTERLITKKPIYRDDHQFFEMAKPTLSYCRLIDTWVECLRPWQVMVIPYERDDLYKKSSIADFLYRAGLAELELPYGNEGLKVNQSLSREYIEVKKSLNRIPKSKTKERVTITCLERLSARSGRATPYRLSEELSREIEAFVGPENARLNECYIKGDAQLKASSGKSPPSDAEAISEDAIAIALTAFEKEYASPRMRLLTVDYAMRAFLRRYAKSVHSALHQLRRWHWSQVYRN